MGCFWSDFKNEDFVKDLSREVNTDIVLLGINGFSYFGNLQAIQDCRIAILSPAVQSEANAVEILTPSGAKTTTSFLRVDLWTVVAKGSGIVSDPLVSSCTVTPTADEAEAVRSEPDSLICLLKRMIGDSISLTTMGGFTISGILSSMDDDVAIISVDNIYLPGPCEPITSATTRSITVNLKAITSVGSSLLT